MFSCRKKDIVICLTEFRSTCTDICPLLLVPCKRNIKALNYSGTWCHDCGLWVVGCVLWVVGSRGVILLYYYLTLYIWTENKTKSIRIIRFPYVALSRDVVTVTPPSPNTHKLRYTNIQAGNVPTCLWGASCVVGEIPEHCRIYTWAYPNRVGENMNTCKRVSS